MYSEGTLAEYTNDFTNGLVKSTFESLDTRISTLHETTKHVSILIERLQNLHFQPGSLPLPLDLDDEDEGNVLSELVNEIRETLKEVTESLDSLKEEVVEFPSGKNGGHNTLLRESLEHMLSRAQRDINESNNSFHEAIQTAKQSLAAAQQLEKDLLASTLKTPEPIISPTSASPISSTYRSTRGKQGPLTSEEKEVAASSDVTAALRRTHNLMLSELSRSQFANQTLEESTLALSELSEKYSTLDTLLAGSKNLLGSLLRSQKSDTWYLESAFFILAVTIGWLIFRRFIYGPAWWLVWLPLKFLYRILIWTFVALGIGGAKGVSTGMAEVQQSERPSLIVHNQATRAPKVEGQVGRTPPVIKVGGGGRGAPPRSTEPGQMQEQKEESSMVEKIGKIIGGDEKDTAGSDTSDEPLVSGEAVQVLGQQQQEIVPNPKKRMFDTGVEEKKEQHWKKDEL